MSDDLILDPGGETIAEHGGVTMAGLIASLAANGEQLAVALAVHIAAEVARALAHSHDRHGPGPGHRHPNLTAAKIMFARTGEVRLIDSGKAEGGQSDHGADLHALGLLFWYLLSGSDPEQRCDATSATLPPLSVTNPQVPAALDEIVARALHPQPEKRFHTALEFIAAVTPFMPIGYAGGPELARQVARCTAIPAQDAIAHDLARARQELASRVPAKPPRQRKAILLAPLAAATVIVAGIYLWPRTTVDAPRERGDGRAPAALAPPTSATPSPPATPPHPLAPAHPLTLSSPLAPPSALAPHLAGQPQPARPARTTPIPPLGRPPTAFLPSSPAATSHDLMAAAKDRFEAEDFAQALQLARAAARQGAGADAYILIGTCLAIGKDYGGARAALAHALRLSPKNPEATRLLSELGRDLGDEAL